jgi:hypothetical protein
MAVFSLTKAEVINRIETLLMNLIKRAPTHQESKLISDAFNQALIDLCMDSGISSWRFMRIADTEDTTSGTAYVDLDENIYNVISGTVRIASENTNLAYMSMEYFYSTDPNQDDTGCPAFYGLAASGDAETMRMYFKPIPDATYTIAFTAESIPDEDAISSFPAWTHACLKDKATENALRDLGLADAAVPFALSYTRRKQDNKASQGYDGPIHINRVGAIRNIRGLESRLPD